MPGKTLPLCVSTALAFCLAACTSDAPKSPDSSAVRSDTSSAAPAPSPSPAPSLGTAVSTRGLGGVMVGMTLAEASAATNGALSAPPAADTAECGYATWKGLPAGVRFMTARGRIARVDVDRGDVATEAGAHIGVSEDSITKLYAGHVQTTPAKYTAGHTLTVRGASPIDSIYRLVFETDGKRVTRYRAGRMPEVAFVEGCG